MDFVLTVGARLLLELILEGGYRVGTRPKTESRCLSDGLIRKYGQIYAVTQKGINALERSTNGRGPYDVN